MLNMNVEVEVEVGAKVFLKIKFMPFEKAAVMGFDLMPGSVEHVEIILMIVLLPQC